MDTDGGKNRNGSHLKTLKPLTAADRADPEKFFDDHLKSLMPDAAKEIEWAMRFGSDTQRAEMALKVAAIKGRTSNPQTSNIPPPAVFIINASIPSRFAPVLEANVASTTTTTAPTLQRLDDDTAVVTVEKSPVDDATNGDNE